MRASLLAVSIALAAGVTCGTLPSPALAAPGGLRPLPGQQGTIAMAARETEAGVHRVYEGHVARVEMVSGKGNTFRVVLDGKSTLQRVRALADPKGKGGERPLPVSARTPDRDRFEITLPERAACPLIEGDPVRAELWTVGSGARRESHARLLRDGRPLLFENEVPAGWRFEPTVPAEAKDAAEAPVRIIPPGGAAFEVSGYVTGTVEGTLLVAWGRGRRVALLLVAR